MDQALERELIAQLDRLPQAEQVRVLEFARHLAGATVPQGEPADNLLAFAGLFSPEECDELERVIAEGCASVNPDEW